MFLFDLYNSYIMLAYLTNFVLHHLSYKLGNFFKTRSVCRICIPALIHQFISSHEEKRFVLINPKEQIRMDLHLWRSKFRFFHAVSIFESLVKFFIDFNTRIWVFAQSKKFPKQNSIRPYLGSRLFSICTKGTF